MRVILFTGKGGVGKTTVAAATALHSARLGKRTVVLSTDAAHSLGDSFDVPLGPEPTQIGDKLWAQETDVEYNLRKHWGTVEQWLRSLLQWRGLDELVADEIAILPGMDELSALLWINQHCGSGEYDVVVVDCAPTGETLKLLSVPDVAGWWVEKMLPIHRRVVSVLRPVIRPFTDLPLPGDDVYAAGEDLFRRLEELHLLLADPDISSVRLVVNAEKMVIKEAQRTFTYLNLYGYATDAVVCNRLLPDEVQDGYFAAWKVTRRSTSSYQEASASPHFLSASHGAGGSWHRDVGEGGGCALRRRGPYPALRARARAGGGERGRPQHPHHRPALRDQGGAVSGAQRR
jgi:arsenite-transporting ATPase